VYIFRFIADLLAWLKLFICITI
jgi:hypothetical protein